MIKTRSKTLCAEEAGFNAALDANLIDHDTRLVYADWLQDRDDPRAAGYRALGLLRRFPRTTIRKVSPNDKDHSLFAYTTAGNVWAYSWAYDGAFCSDAFLAFGLPKLWIVHVVTDSTLYPSTNHQAGWREWCTRKDMEDAAALGFAALTEKEQDWAVDEWLGADGRPVDRNL